MDDRDTELNDRYISRVEFGAFDRSQRSFVADVTERFDKLDRKIDGITNKGTDWRAIIAAIGVLGTFLSLSLAGVSMVFTIIAWGLNGRLNTGDANTAQLSEVVRVHQMKAAEVNGEQSQRLLQTEEKVTTLDASLQREMRLLDDALQREMRMLMDAPNEKIHSLESRIKTIEDTMYEHTKNGHPASVLDRVRMLEEKEHH